MRAIDQVLGPALCWLITIVYRLFPFGREKRGCRVSDVKRILFVKPAEMGSTILLYPSLCRARELWPESELFFLVFSENRDAVNLLINMPSANVFTIRSDTLSHFFYDSIRHIFALRRKKIDAAIDLEFYSRAAAILTALVGARYSAGYERYTMEGLYKGNLLTHPVQYNCHIHTAAGFLLLIEALSAQSRQVPLVKVPVVPRESLAMPPFNPTRPEKDAVWKIIQEANKRITPVSRLVILNANASDLMPLRKWPLENYISLARKLMTLPDVIIVLTGVASETKKAEEIVREIGGERVASITGRTSLRSLVTLYTISALMVTNDSGPSHFASLTDMPSITLFGPETPEIYGPLGASKVAIVSNLACSPCVSSYNHRRSPCDDNVCMKSITVESVWQACQTLLAKAEHRSVANLLPASRDS
jgi:ADP-heptose:LPS heptosyltransferase